VCLAIDKLAIHRGVATGCTGVDMSTPLLPEVVPEIDANPLSFYSGGGGWGLCPWTLLGAHAPHARHACPPQAGGKMQTADLTCGPAKG